VLESLQLPFIGSVLIAVGLAMLAISKPDIGHQSILAKFGRLSLGVYALHFAFVCLLFNVYDHIEINPYWEILYPLSSYALSLGATIFLSKIRMVRRFLM